MPPLGTFNRFYLWVIVSASGGEGGVKGEAWVRICESFNDAEGKRYIYGMGGDCLASLAKEDYSVELEEVGPLRVVIKCSGAFEADIPMHHYAGYRPFRMVTRIYAYAGQTHLRVLHTVVVACNPRETEVEEIALRVPVSLKTPVRFRAAPLYPPACGGIKGGRLTEGNLNPDEAILLGQRSDNQFRVEQQRAGQQRTIAEGERTEGWITIEDDHVGVGVGLRYMPRRVSQSVAGDRNWEGR